jgi:hypothetical protein
LTRILILFLDQCIHSRVHLLLLLHVRGAATLMAATCTFPPHHHRHSCAGCSFKRVTCTGEHNYCVRGHNFLSPELLNSSSLFMYIVMLLSDLCLVRFIISLMGTPRSLLLVT